MTNASRTSRAAGSRAGRRLTTIAALVLLSLSSASCGGPTRPGSPASSDPVSGQGAAITVLAAASLTESFGQIARDFEATQSATQPATVVTLSFGGSSTLAAQITAGAPADVFAAASEATMSVITDAGAVANEPRPFASNTLQIAVPASNPGQVTGLADLADPSRRIALCAPQVPCGAAAEKVFAAARLTARPDTLEQDVKAVLNKVALDEVDAGLVYATDVRAAGDRVRGIAFPQADQAVTVYPIANLTQSSHPAAAQAFVDYVTSPPGQAVLIRAGFGQPR